MADLVIEDTLVFGAVNVTVRELSVGQLMEFIEGRTTPQVGVDTLLVLSEHAVPAALVYKATNLSDELCAALTPRQLARVADKVHEMNPFFARLQEGLLEVHAQMQATSGESAQPLSSEE